MLRPHLNPSFGHWTKAIEVETVWNHEPAPGTESNRLVELQTGVGMDDDGTRDRRKRGKHPLCPAKRSGVSVQVEARGADVPNESLGAGEPGSGRRDEVGVRKPALHDVGPLMQEDATALPDRSYETKHPGRSQVGHSDAGLFDLRSDVSSDGQGDDLVLEAGTVHRGKQLCQHDFGAAGVQTGNDMNDLHGEC